MHCLEIGQIQTYSTSVEMCVAHLCVSLALTHVLEICSRAKRYSVSSRLISHTLPAQGKNEMLRII